eukprot:5713046-Pyramimonas_sp.AAC.1
MCVRPLPSRASLSNTRSHEISLFVRPDTHGNEQPHMKQIGDATFSCVTVSAYDFRLLRCVAHDDTGAPCRTAHATTSL